MPILSLKPTAPEIPKADPILVTGPESKGVTVDTRYTPTQNLLANISGSKWTVEYYSQVLDEDVAPASLNLQTPAINQQYRKIKQFELRVQNPLNTSQNDQNEMETTGTAYVYSMLIPNKGDVFLADMGDGREGLFEITNSIRKSVFKETVHEVEYIWVQHASQPYYDNLIAKTVDTLVFVYDYMQYGQNPLVQEDTYNALQNLDHQRAQIAQMYFSDFVSNEYKTLLVPGQGRPTYDPYLTRFVLGMFTTSDSYLVRTVREMNCDGEHVIKAASVWRALMERSLPMMKVIGERIGRTYARAFERTPLLEGIYHSGITYVAYLKDAKLGIDAKNSGFIGKPLGDNFVPPPTDPDAPPVTGVPMLPAIAATDYYVFSQKFYRQEEGQSKLELQVWNYLEDKALDISTIVAMAESYPLWKDMERFYYGPVLVMLMKAILRST